MGEPALWSALRGEIIGSGACIRTPFGLRHVVYSDYTASGRAVRFLEQYLLKLLELYGNTHTEDDATGGVTTRRLHAAEATIKRLLGAGPQYHIIEAGSGATGAIHRLQEILGIYVPPAAKRMFEALARETLGEAAARRLAGHLQARRPVVFVGPYEHHSNEISWRECFAEVIEIGLTDRGLFDLDDLRAKVARPEYEGRLKIGSFSAASNVTGLITPVHDVARILHRHGALACFDYAAAAPYSEIRVQQDGDDYFDALFFSPHKFLGGPGSCGVLLIHERIYPRNLPPSMAGGGTVDFVNATMQEYSRDIEVRERAGTPGILQTLRAALAMELKEALGLPAIAARERDLLSAVLGHLRDCPEVELVAPMDPEHNLPIVSFNVRAEGSYLHPRFVVRLLNDLFGIQARAGCSCAGPYGHRLLHISDEVSARYKQAILEGNLGLKPGWARVSFHFLMSDEELRFICQAVRFVAEQGKCFLPLYSFDVHTGEWRHRQEGPAPSGAVAGPPAPAEPEPLSLAQALLLWRTGSLPEGGAAADCGEAPTSETALVLARAAAERLKGDMPAFKTTQRDLIPFIYC